MPDTTPVPDVTGATTLAESLFELGDIMDQVKSAVVMYKNNLVNEGFSEVCAESMCITYHNAIVSLAFYPQSHK